LAFGRMTHRLTVSVRQAELSQKMAAVGELASYLSHEIRNPLSSIKLNLQSLARDARAGVTPDDFPRVVELCLSEVERLNSVVYTVLDLGRDRQRDGPVAHCSAHEVVHAALDLLRPRLERAGIEVQEDLAVQESTVRADADRLKGVIINLVVNACDAMPEGGRIRIRTRAAMDEGGAPRLCIHVADEGPGIPPHLREAIFQPFFTTKADGNGIGLSTAAATASEWGGSIEFRKDSELVPGAEFVLSLVPVQATGAPDAGNGRRSTSHRRRLHGTGLVHAATDAKLAADEGNR
jgi:signal transduction histidine kinase